jgi:hypothetical protein
MAFPDMSAPCRHQAKKWAHARAVVWRCSPSRGCGMRYPMPGARGKIIDRPALNLLAGRAHVRDVPEAARPYKWKPGQSGNPTGRGGLYLECRRLAAEASPDAMRRLITLMDVEDERVAYMATVAVLDRSGVKPIDYDPAQDVIPPMWDPGALTAKEREQLKAMLEKMVKRGKP